MQPNKLNLVILSVALSYLSQHVSVNAFSTPQSNGRFMSKSSTASLEMGRINMPQWHRSKSNNRMKRHSASQNMNTKSVSLFRGSSRKMVVPNLLQKLKRQLAVFLTSAFLILGPVQLNSNSNSPISFQPPTAHASTTVAPKTKVDKIIDEYVRKHMFNDDLYDPIESTYRETIQDSVTNAYPSKLSSATQSVLGKKFTRAVGSSSGVAQDGQSIKFILKLVDTIHVKFGVPKPFIVPALFLVFGGIPCVLVLAGLMSFSYNQKAMTERMAVERYGESVLDAEELAVADDDDDEDDDYEDVDDDDDSDEDDDDSDDDE